MDDTAIEKNRMNISQLKVSQKKKQTHRMPILLLKIL